MVRNGVFAALGFILLFAPGCLPEKRVAWSPDGSRAAVLGADGLYLCDATGNLSPRLVESVARVGWFTDSQRIAAVTKRQIRTWEEASALIPEARRGIVIRAADNLKAELLSSDEPIDKLHPAAISPLTGGERGATLLYLREYNAAGLAERVGSDWANFEDATLTAWQVQVLTLSDEDSAEIGPVLYASLDEIHEPRVAAHGNLIAFCTNLPRMDGPEALTLCTVPAAGGPVDPIAPDVAQFYDWTTDGDAVVYAAANGVARENVGRLQLGVIGRQMITDEQGSPLAQRPNPEALAGVIFDQSMRVRCLPDGRILFSSVEMQLPMAGGDEPRRIDLFALNPQRGPAVTRVLTRAVVEQLPDALNSFEPSPSGETICIVNDSCETILVHLATGAIWKLPIRNSEVSDDNKTRTMPSWRSDRDLTFSIPPQAPGSHRAEIVLGTIDWAQRRLETTNLSASWPPAVITDFLEAAKPADAAEEAAPAAD